MTEPKPTSANGNADLITELLAVRQHAIGLVVSSGRMLEALGHPVQTAIVTRRERRHLVQRSKVRK